MATFAHDDDDVIAAINITPFVDIILVVLIIFMVTSSFIAKASVQMELPSAAHAGQVVESTVNIEIDRQGQLYLNGEPASYPAIASHLRREHGQNPRVQAVIAADKGTSYGQLMDIIDLVKEHGITSFALSIERKST